MTVENLEIKVKTPGAKRAANNLNSVADALNNVQQAANSLTNANNAAGKGVQRVGAAAQKATKHTNGFASSLLRIAKYRVMRTIIKEITSAFSEGMKNAYAFSDAIATEGHRFAEALDSMSSSGLKMKNQLGSALISLLSAIMPLIISAINLITRLADALSQLFAAFTGGTYLKAIDVNKKWGDSATKAAKAAKEWKNQLLGFDEINRLEEPSNSGGSGGSNELDPSQMFTDSPLSDWAQKVRENLALIELTASGFLLALGCILLFSGANIPLGLALIAVGAIGFAKALKEDWSSVDPKIAKAVASVTAIVGGAVLAIGALLTFTGANIPLGIGMMLAGAAMIATSVAIHWNSIPSTVRNILAEILLIVGGALLALGIIITLATPSFSALGLGLIVAGAAALAGGVALNWENMPTKIKNVVSQIMLILGNALLVLGIILCLSGAGIPLGIGLIMAGAASIFGSYAMQSDTLIETVKGVCDTIWWIVTGLFQGIHDWIQNIIDGINIFLGKSKLAQKSETRAAEIEASGEIWNGMNYATGGFPTEGQLFIANEAGPELVGTMGGRNAVANQNEIVEGIRQGVFDAVMAANSNGERQVDVRVYLDSREIKIGQDRYNRAMGVV